MKSQNVMYTLMQLYILYDLYNKTHFLNNLGNGTATTMQTPMPKYIIDFTLYVLLLFKHYDHFHVIICGENDVHVFNFIHSQTNDM